MTWGQWLFEYHALRKKEEDEGKFLGEVMVAATNALRETLVGVLGLHLFAEEKPAGSGPTPFIPAAALFSNHHLLKHVIEAKEKAKQAEEAMQDDAFEALSQKLAKGDFGDLHPILRGGNIAEDKNAYWRSEEAQLALRRAGVTNRPASAGAAPHFSRKVRKGVVFGPIEAAEPAADTATTTVDRVELEPGVFSE